MSYNKSPLAFDDIREALDRALAAPKGIRIPCANRGAAVTLRSRFNYYRKMDRSENRRNYTSDHPMHGKSAYDRLALRIPPKGTDQENVLYIEPHLISDMTIEEIT